MSEASARMALRTMSENTMLKNMVSIQDSIISLYQMDIEQKKRAILAEAHQAQTLQNQHVSVANSLQTTQKKLRKARVENWLWRTAALLIFSKSTGLW